MSTITHYPSEIPATARLEGVFDAMSDAQWAEGFEAGYRRAVNNLLADIALITAEVGRELASDNAEVRQGLRQLRAQLERHLEGESAVAHTPTAIADGYVDGGLGI